MKSYMNSPILGRAFKPFSNQMVEISKDNISSFKYKKVIFYKKQEFVIFKNDKDEEIMQSIKALRFVRCKSGEDNIASKLTNNQSIEIFERANDGETLGDLAKEFNIAKHTVSSIKNLRSRIKVTLAHLNGEQEVKAEPVFIAKRSRNKKLSMSLARFIRKDFNVNKFSIEVLSQKYCVTKGTIRRILNNKMYKE